MPLLRIQAFVNTLDVEAGSDLLSDPETARGWFVDAGFLERDKVVSDADLEFARGVRAGIRGLLGADSSRSNEAEALGALRKLTEAHLARLTVSDAGVVGLENAEEGSLGCGLFDLLLIAREAQQNGSWSRLKICANPDCQWAFYDRSRNQQGNWCDMAVCGNRLKNRQLRARRR